jgi:hypothetical protein
LNVFYYSTWRAGSVEAIPGSSDRSVLVLTSLASGAEHGYALIETSRSSRE